MAFPVNTLTLRIVQSSQKGNQFSNLLYYEPATGFTDATDFVAIANAALTIFGAHYKTVMHEDTSVIHVEARYYGDGIDVVGGSTGAAITGTVSDGASLDDQTCFLVRRLTGKPGRTNRGRIFISCLSGAQWEDGTIATAERGTIQAVAAAFATDITLGGQLCHARHYRRSDNQMIPIKYCRALNRLVSRRDRMKRFAYDAI